MKEIVKKIFNYRKILFSITAIDIKTKYAGSILGCLWVYPLVAGKMFEDIFGLTD